VRWPIALQAAVAIGLPIAIFTLAGREDLGLLASTGGFTALYLTNRSRRQRAILIPLIAVALLLSAAVGVIASGRVATSIIALLVIVIAASVIFLGFGVGPPGVLFPVLVGGVASHLAAPVALGGAAVDGWLVLGLIATGSVIAYAVVVAPLVIPRVRAADAERHGESLRFSLDEPTRVILIRIVIAALIAAAIAAPLGIHRAYWVTLTIVAILQNGHRVRLTALRGIHRLLGTLVGVGLFAVIELAKPSGWGVVVVLVILQFLVEIVVIRNYGLALVLITPLALTISAQGAATPSSLVVDRVVDTLIGAGIAMIVLLGSLLLRRLRRGGAAVQPE
jgi:hypothetical protein